MIDSIRFHSIRFHSIVVSYTVYIRYFIIRSVGVRYYIHVIIFIQIIIMSDRKSITINSDSLFGGGSKKSATRRTKGSSSGTNRRLRPSSIVQPSTLKKTLLERIKQHQKLREQGRDRDRDRDNDPDQSRSAIDPSSSSKNAPDAESSFTQSMDFLRKLALKKRQNATQRRSSESIMTEPAKTSESKMLNQVADTLHNGEIITNTGLIGLPIINTDISSIMKPAMVASMVTPMAMAPEISNLPFGMIQNTLPLQAPTPTPNITQLADIYNSTIASSVDNNNSNTNPTVKNTDDLPIHVPDDPESFLPSIFIKEAPPHGCLKNGTKPTFREWANKLINKPVETIKNMFGGGGGDGDGEGATTSASTEVTGGLSGGARKTVSKPIDNPENVTGMRVKIRRTQKKKYRIGKHDDVVGVLLKNKESQRHIQKQHLALKQKTIGEIRKHLYEHHLLKIGSNAPPDVLRRMYEDSILTGDVKNTNKGVLLHNFMSGES